MLSDPFAARAMRGASAMIGASAKNDGPSDLAGLQPDTFFDELAGRLNGIDMRADAVLGEVARFVSFVRCEPVSSSASQIVDNAAGDPTGFPGLIAKLSRIDSTIEQLSAMCAELRRIA